MSEPKDLLRCPFCNGKAILIPFLMGWLVRHKSQKRCAARIYFELTKDKAISAWNRRSGK